MRTFLFTIICCFWIVGSYSQNISLFKYLKQNDIKQIQVKADFDYILSHKYADTTYKSHVYWNVNNELHKVDTKLSVRGRYRRRVCSFPPIRLNFSKNDLQKESIQSDFDKYKLVTHCDTLPVFEDYVMREFLAYEIYQKLTDASLQVYPLEIEYIFKDDEENPTRITKRAFLIENEDELADRMNTTVFDGFIAQDDSKLENYESYLASLFMLMIANDDYDFYTNRNVCILEGDNFTPIPYDFDFCGLVNAHYAIANPNIPTHRLRDRVIVQKYPNGAGLKKAIEQMLSKEEIIISTIEAAEYLSKTSRKDIKKYINSFFKYLEKNQELPHHEVITY